MGSRYGEPVNWLEEFIAAEKDIPGQAVEWLRALLGDRLIAVVLYGSRARGDHHPYSDWDLLVIAEGLPQDVWERARFFTGAPILGQLQCMAKTPEEFESYLPAVYLDIGLDGQVLFDPGGYAAERLAKLHRIIAAAGLYREAVPGAGFIWDWDDPPPPGKWTNEWDFMDLGRAK